MGTISLVIPQLGIADTTEDVKVQNAFTTIQTVINGNIDSTNLSAATAQSAAVNQSGQTVKGSSIIATSQTTASAAFTTLATPDQVTGVVLAAAGLLRVSYRAVWSCSAGANAGQAAIFLGANQLVVDAGGAGPATQSGFTSNGAGTANGLSSIPQGLQGSNSVTSYGSDAVTGQALAYQQGGGACEIFAPAGTYTVSVQFKTSSGTLTVAQRRLYVEAVSYA